MSGAYAEPRTGELGSGPQFGDEEPVRTAPAADFTGVVIQVHPGLGRLCAGVAHDLRACPANDAQIVNLHNHAVDCAGLVSVDRA